MGQLTEKCSIPRTIIAIWFVLTFAGLLGLGRYGMSSESTRTTMESWPKNRKLNQIDGKYNLVLFLHPNCSCSMATLTELERLLAKVPQKRINTRLVFCKPGLRNEAERIQTTALVKRAFSIPDWDVNFDWEGIVFESFQPTSSGELFLFAPEGRLLFQGGLTASRGHEGESNGGRQVLKLLLGEPTLGDVFAPVFGCPLSSSSASRRRAT